MEKEVGFSRHHFYKYHKGELLGDYEALGFCSDQDLQSDMNLQGMKKLMTMEPEKLHALKQIHKELAKDVPLEGSPYSGDDPRGKISTTRIENIDENAKNVQHSD